MWRALVVLLAAAACGSQTNAMTCSVDGLVMSDVAAFTYQPCGVFALGSANYTDDSMHAAQLCVLNAIASKQGFSLVYDAANASGQTSSSSNSREGWSASPGDMALLLHNYAGTGTASNGAMQFVTSRSCDTVTATTGCTPKVGVPCLTCNSTDLGNLVCMH